MLDFTDIAQTSVNHLNALGWTEEVLVNYRSSFCHVMNLLIFKIAYLHVQLDSLLLDPTVEFTEIRWFDV